MRDIFYFILGFAIFYIGLFLANILSIYLFVYLDKGVFPITLDDFLWPIRPSLMAIGVYILTAILIPADKDKKGNKK